MVQAIPQSPNNWTQPDTQPALYDPVLLRAARQIYQTYRTVHPQRLETPLGVVIHRYHYRGHLIFKNCPLCCWMNVLFLLPSFSTD
uniref:Uncharacterized protein n=1 Tax=Desertifilum tharense IPPAS B-1220 TaxID=1781255 RepID=A0ACD5GPK6_9CYAN